jgi:Flp pilus assembly protein TadG
MKHLLSRLMRSYRTRIGRDEQGVTMILWVLLLVGLLTIVAIVIDLGNARQQKRELQNAADAAALAGASVIKASTATCTGGDQLRDAMKYV